MLNPILSDIALTMEQIKKAEASLSSYSHEDMLVLLIENSGQIIATNGKNTKKYDLAIIAALSVAAFESTAGLAKAMGQKFDHIENKGNSSNLYIKRLSDYALLVIDYPPSIPQNEIEKVATNFSEQINLLSEEWEIIQKGSQKGKGPLTKNELDNDVDNIFGNMN